MYPSLWGTKLQRNEEHAVSNNGLFPLVNNYSSLAFLMEGKERWADVWNWSRIVTTVEGRETVKIWLIFWDKIHKALEIMICVAG